MQYKLIGLVVCFILSQQSFSQRLDSMDYRARNRADTSAFSSNQREGWFIYNSYLATSGRDSCVIEVVSRHDKSINWNEFQPMGRIKERRFIPREEQVIPFSLGPDGYQLKIAKDGKCYVRLSSGQLPQQDPVVLPFRLMYRVK